MHWQSGHYGSDRAAGPSSPWIDAVVAVGAPTARRLVRLTDPGDASPVEVVPDLQAVLPAGPWQSSPTLDAALSSAEWWVSAAIYDRHVPWPSPRSADEHRAGALLCTDRPLPLWQGWALIVR